MFPRTPQTHSSKKSGSETTFSFSCTLNIYHLCKIFHSTGQRIYTANVTSTANKGQIVVSLANKVHTRSQLFPYHFCPQIWGEGKKKISFLHNFLVASLSSKYGPKRFPLHRSSPLHTQTRNIITDQAFWTIAFLLLPSFYLYENERTKISVVAVVSERTRIKRTRKIYFGKM